MTLMTPLTKSLHQLPEARDHFTPETSRDPSAPSKLIGGAETRLMMRLVEPGAATRETVFPIESGTDEVSSRRSLSCRQRLSVVMNPGTGVRFIAVRTGK